MPASQPNAVPIVPAAALPAGPLLSRRVPQANLAPELRRSAAMGAQVPEPSPPPDAERARDALSRFQASRQAAQEQVGTERSGFPNGTGYRR